MADLPHTPPEAEVRARWGAFAWTPANAAEAASIIARCEIEELQKEFTDAEGRAKELSTNIALEIGRAHV